jgi:signal-transduction protein with cAMP-binding, CBS, and nucleotidyltransferase domain
MLMVSDLTRMNWRTSMKCRDLMSTDLVWVPGTASVFDAARVMRDRSVGLLLVSEPTPGRAAGVVTDRDLVIRVCAEGLNPRDQRVGGAATVDLVSCTDGEDLAVAEARMTDAQIARLVIVDDARRIVGLLSLTDILRGERGGRALKTANAVLSREAEGPHAPLESIHLTPSTRADEEEAAKSETVMVGGDHRGSTREFPG